MPNVPKYFLYISYGSTLTANVKAKRSTSKLRSLLSWSKVQDLCNTNILLIHWLKPFLKVYWKILWVLWKPTLMLLLAPFSEWFLFRARCLWLSTKKKSSNFWVMKEIVTLQNWFINLCPFVLLFFAYWWKKSQQLRKKIMILTFDSEGYCTPISWMNPLTHLCLKQTDRDIEGSNNFTLTAMNRYHISFLN